MNWKKIILATLGGSFAATIGQWANSTMSGGHVAFTTGNIVVPALATVFATLAALFAKPPHQG